MLEYGSEQCIKFYDKRWSQAALGQFDDVLVEIAQRSGMKTIHEAFIQDISAKLMHETAREFEHVLQRAVQKGLLEPIGTYRNKQYVFPITSLSTFLAANGDFEKCKIAFREAHEQQMKRMNQKLD